MARQNFITMVATTLLVMAPLAHATLGEIESTVHRDHQALPTRQVDMAAATSTTQATGVRVYQFRAVGYSVKEFVGLDGKVFAISWQGRSHPNFATLLGSYHGEWRAADAHNPKGRRHLRRPTESANVKVSTGGHQGAVHGMMVLKGHTPPGWTEKDAL